jgi:pimeloyl-ACP methyl ester carboxylesterase
VCNKTSPSARHAAIEEETMWKSRIVRIITSAFVISVVVVAVLLIYRTTMRARTDDRNMPPQPIDSVESIELGGVKQWLFIHGEDRTKPVLLWLHGGPGDPLMPAARPLDADLIKHFVVVHWDQRGAGKSYDGGLPPEMLTTERYIADTHDLVQELRQRFNAPKIYLVGHSWGAQLGALTVTRYPELFYAYVAVSQPVSIPQGQRAVYPRLLDQARATGNQEALHELEVLGPPPWSTLESALIFGKWNGFFGGAMRNSTAEQLQAAAEKSPVYTPEDFEKLGQGQLFSLTAMYTYILQINLFEQAPRLDVPVYFFQGRHDGQAPGELTERYYNSLVASHGKTLVWFEESAHVPMYEEPAKFNQQMLRVLAETASAVSSVR